MPVCFALTESRGGGAWCVVRDALASPQVHTDDLPTPPTFRPTLEEFRDPMAYITSCVAVVRALRARG